MYTHTSGNQTAREQSLIIAQEYPSDPLRKITALQTKVKLAGNLSNKQNLAENLANREIASWKKKIVHKHSLHFGCTDQFDTRLRDLLFEKWLVVCLILKFIYQQSIVVCSLLLSFME